MASTYNVEFAPSPPNEPARHIRPLTSLRFCAAMMVVASHYFGFRAGYVGVGFFFVLSGYVLALNYSEVADRGAFWWKRFARIYPLHLLTLLLMLPFTPSIWRLLPSIPLLQSWLPAWELYYTGNAPAWSISDEAFFYICFPWLLRLTRWPVLLWGAALMSIALWWSWEFRTWTLESGGYIPLPGRHVREPVTLWVFYILPITRLFEFAIGMALVKISGRAGTGAELAAIGLTVATVALTGFVPAAIGAALFFVPAAAALVWTFSRSRGLIARLLAHPLPVLLGEASFALYMIHVPMMKYLGASMLTAAMAVVGSIAIYTYVERPAQRWLLRHPIGR